MESSMLILLPHSVVYSHLRLLSQLHHWPCHVQGFILYLILYTPHLYSGLAHLISRKSHASYQKPDSDIYLSDHIY